MRYKVDLKGFMADCEANYARLQRLFPAMDRIDQHQFALPGADEQVFALRVLERSPYTSEVEIARVGTTISRWLDFPAIKIRLYHDARLAEVVGFSREWRIRPRYPYPNRAMHQPDEKAQWNHFLAEWLSICIHNGYAVDSPYEFVE